MIFAAVSRSFPLFPRNELIHTSVQVSLSKDGEFVATKWQIYLLYLAILVVHGLLNVRDSSDDSLLSANDYHGRSRSAPKCSPR